MVNINIYENFITSYENLQKLINHWFLYLKFKER